MPNAPDDRVPAAFVVVQRDEGQLLRAWIDHHARLLPQCIVVVDDGSTDTQTHTVLREIIGKAWVHVIPVKAAHFDQEGCVDLAIRVIRDQYPGVRWLFSLDADEFLNLSTTFRDLLDTLDSRGVVYASAAHVNAIPDLQPGTTLREPWYLGTTRYYRPWIERVWQEEGYFRKAFCRIHADIRFAVGNHYVFHDRLVRAFPTTPYTPVHLDSGDVFLRHFEMRDCGEQLLRKLSNLAQRQVVPGANSDAPWWERNHRLDEVYRNYMRQPERLYADFVTSGPRSLWGTTVPAERMLQLEAL